MLPVTQITQQKTVGQLMKGELERKFIEAVVAYFKLWQGLTEASMSMLARNIKDILTEFTWRN
jgi:hypothetical protein